MGAVFCIDPGKATEGIEADDLAVVIVWLVNAPKCGEESHVLAPTHAKFHDDAMNRDDLLVQIRDIEDPAEGLTRQVQAEIMNELIIRQRRVAQEARQ